MLKNVYVQPFNDLDNVNDILNNVFMLDCEGTTSINIETLDNKDDILNIDDVDDIKQGVLKNSPDFKDYFKNNKHNYEDENMSIEEQKKDCFQDFISMEFSDGALQVERFSTQSPLYQYLLDWYGRNEIGAMNAKKLMYKKVRGLYARPVNLHDLYYFIHGIGYDTISTDLLGFEASGQAKGYFENSFVYGKRKDEDKFFDTDMEQKRLKMVYDFEKSLSKE